MNHKTESLQSVLLDSALNTFKDVIFSNAEELRTWKELPEFRQRFRSLSTREGEQQAQSAGAKRIMWALSGFGGVPDDFEDWIEPIMDRSVQSRTGEI